MVFVTGGTGLLGSHLLFYLAQKHDKIRALYRNEKAISRVAGLFKLYAPENGEHLFLKIEWVKGDILDIPSLEVAFKGVSHVYHCAGMVSFEKKHFNELIKTNREGTANIVNFCLLHGVQKLCYVSSTAALGGQSNELVNENTKWKLSPKTSGYAISKYSAEKEVWRGVEEGLDCVIVNPSIIFGSGDWNESSLTIFRTVNKGLSFYTRGQNGFVDARDVAELMIRLMESEIKNERFICVGVNAPFKLLLTKIALKLNKKPPFINTPNWLMGLTWRFSWLLSKIHVRNATVTKASAQSALSNMSFDNSKIKNALHFSFRDLDEMIENTVKSRL